ncbi:hypothetical protein [Clostridium sp. C8-1-8]|uniref:hypothetical protein n=1 Tax=Clostridium sp. C8-1-8 TaxID=2698831 RepID=UPI00136CD34A|nr:hypothetical protein [Clostridium sp. C8-1-8]
MMKTYKYIRKYIILSMLILMLVCTSGCNKAGDFKVSKNSLISYEVSNNKIILNRIDTDSGNSDKYIFKDKSIDSNSVITEYNKYWLINSPKVNQVDQLFTPYKENKMIELDGKGYYLIGNINDNLILVKYEKKEWKLKSFNTSTNQESDFRFSIKLDNSSKVLQGASNSGKYLTVFTTNLGSYVLEIKNSKVNYAKISDKILSGYVTFIDDKFYFLAARQDNVESPMMYVFDNSNFTTDKENFNIYKLNCQYNIFNNIISEINYNNNNLIITSEKGGNILCLYKLNMENKSIEKLYDKQIKTQSVVVINKNPYIIASGEFFKIDNNLKLKKLN